MAQATEAPTGTPAPSPHAIGTIDGVRAVNALVASLTAAATAVVDRRRLLFGLGAATASAAIPAVATAAVAPVDEDPELVTLAAALPAIRREYIEARDAYRAVLDEWWPRWPRAPEILQGGVKWETNLAGGQVYITTEAGERPSRLFSAEAARWNLKDARARLRRCRRADSLAGARERIAHYEPMLAAATEYEAECASIRELSGHDVAKERRDRATEAIIAHIFRTLDVEPRTMAGIIIQARAIEAGLDVDFNTRSCESLVRRWSPGERLAASLVRINATDAA